MFNCKVVGIVGDEEKKNWLVSEMGIDEAIIHSKQDTFEKLKLAVGKNGIDVLFDNVGGSILDNCLRFLTAKGVCVCTLEKKKATN